MRLFGVWFLAAAVSFVLTRSKEIDQKAAQIDISFDVSCILEAAVFLPGTFTAIHMR